MARASSTEKTSGFNVRIWYWTLQQEPELIHFNCHLSLLAYYFAGEMLEETLCTLALDIKIQGMF
jgi:hypothetical protein